MDVMVKFWWFFSLSSERKKKIIFKIKFVYLKEFFLVFCKSNADFRNTHEGLKGVRGVGGGGLVRWMSVCPDLQQQRAAMQPVGPRVRLIGHLPAPTTNMQTTRLYCAVHLPTCRPRYVPAQQTASQLSISHIYSTIPFSKIIRTKQLKWYTEGERFNIPMQY